MYPIGIPLLYGYILWRNRESLNPRVRAGGDNGGEQQQPGASSGSALSFLKPKKEYPTKESVEELHERLEKRKQNPDLVPSLFLWKDFSEKELGVHAERHFHLVCTYVAQGLGFERTCLVAANGTLPLRTPEPSTVRCGDIWTAFMDPKTAGLSGTEHVKS